jgi:hypothetical protein
MEILMKYCPKCRKKKSKIEFSKGNSRKDGLAGYCKPCLSIIAHNYYLKNTQKLKNQSKLYRKINKVKISIFLKTYNLTHKNKRNQYRRNKRITDLNYKLTENLRTRIWSALKGINRSKNTMKLVGCSVIFLKSHLESNFTSGMSWENYGEWHIDHIKPCASFNLSKPEEQRKCFHYTNLQPLWAKDNLTKHNKF